MNLHPLKLTGIITLAAALLVSAAVGADPAAYNATPGTSIILTNQGSGTGPFQWFKDGLRLFNSENITGSETETLVLGECATGDSGYYLLRSGPDMLTNAAYSVSVRVIEEYIIVNVGDPILFRGSEGAYNYKWLKDGKEIAAGTNVFGIAAAQSGDRGIYELLCGARRQVVNARFFVHVIGPYIPDLWSFYSSPYLLDFNFFLRDENDRAITDDPSAFELRCWEDDEHGTVSLISPTETGSRLLRANKQLEGFLVLDYTRSMVDPVRNGDADGDSISDSVESMEDGAKTLIGALPRDARIGLFEFHRADAAYPPQKMAELMRDKAHLTNTIDELWSTNVWTSGASRCWDALYLALQEWRPYNLWDDQRFIVFLSDGRDESSTRFPTNVVALALTNNVKIFCIGYGTELKPGPLQYITSLTGGRYYRATTAAELTEKFQQIAIDLRSQYIVRWATLKRQRTFPPPDDGIAYYFIPKFELTYGPHQIPATGWTNRPYLYEGDELCGRLHFATSLEPENVASLVLRADYVPRGVTRIRVEFETKYPFTIDRIPFSEGGVCSNNWTFTTNQPGEIGFFEFASPLPNDPFSALPFATLGKLVEFKFQGVTNLAECFSQLRVDNSLYSWPGGPILVIDNAGTVGGAQVFEKDVYYVPGTTIFLQVPGDLGIAGPYQWAKDGTHVQDDGRIEGALTYHLTIENCRETDSGSYVLTDQGATAAIFRVHVLPVATETVRLTNAPGTPLVLTNRSEAGFDYRWSRYGYVIYDTLDGRVTGSWTPSLTINECSPADDGVYLLTTGSQPLRTNAIYDVRIETLRFSTNIAAGNEVTLSGSPGGYKYQWFKDGSPLVDAGRISGATTPDLVIRALQPSDFGTYKLECGTLSRYENAAWQLSVYGTNLPPSLRIAGLRSFYSSPYLLDFNFFIRNTTNDDAATLDLAQLTNVVCKENGQPISSSETGYRLLPENKQLEGFLVLDYTMSMLSLTENGDQNDDLKSDSAEQMEAGAKALISALPRDAKIGLFEFHRGDTDYPPQLLAELIRDKTYLTNQIDQIWSNVVWSGGSSRCWDALYSALEGFPTGNPADNQRFLVFLSDGNDESSSRGPEDVITLAQTNNVKICCIGYGKELKPAELMRITAQTEGWYYATTNALDLADRFKQIATNLSSKYILRWATLRRTDAAFTPSFQITDLGLTATNFSYNPSEHQGDELQGHLRFDAVLNPGNVASLVLRAHYIPRGVTRIRVNFATMYPFTVKRIPFGEGGLCPDTWSFATDETAGIGYFDFSSPFPDKPFTALPFATLGKLVEFKLHGVTNLQTCFYDLTVENGLYAQPGGPSLVIDNQNDVWSELSGLPRGTPIWWLNQYGFRTNLILAEIGDPDGDGALTWQEYLAGTNPTNPASVFRLLGAALGSDGWHITFNTESNLVYRLDYADTLPNWEVLQNNLLGTGRSLTVVDPATRAQRFYRVLLVGHDIGLRLVPAGEFAMGDPFNEGAPDERPVHTVLVSAFRAEQYEVTKALWDEVKEWSTGYGYVFANAGAAKATDHPVHTISWYDAVKWCNARSEMEGLTPCYYTEGGLTAVFRTGAAAPFVKWSADGYRLPTEAEWEKAARGGVYSQRFPWAQTDSITHALANYFSTTNHVYDLGPLCGYHPSFTSGGAPYTSMAGYFPANGYGLYDVAGNVWEWCWDWHQSDWYSSPRASTANTPGPVGPLANRVFRGGSWYNNAGSARCSARGALPPTAAASNLGFRCVKR